MRNGRFLLHSKRFFYLCRLGHLNVNFRRDCWLVARGLDDFGLGVVGLGAFGLSAFGFDTFGLGALRFCNLEFATLGLGNLAFR